MSLTSHLESRIAEHGLRVLIWKRRPTGAIAERDLDVAVAHDGVVLAVADRGRPRGCLDDSDTDGSRKADHFAVFNATNARETPHGR